MADKKIEALVNDDPVFFEYYRPLIMAVIFDLSPQDRPWESTDIEEAVNLISKHIQMGEIEVYQEVIEVLRYCQTYRLLGIDNIPKVPQKKYRSLIIPSTPHDLLWYDVVEDMSQYLWKSWIAKQLETNKLLFPFISSLMTDGGFGVPLIPKSISGLRICDVTINRTLLFSLSPNDMSDFCCELNCPDSASILLSSIIRGRFNDADDNFMFLPLVTDWRKRQKIISIEIKNQYNQFSTAYTKDTGRPSPSQRKYFLLAPLIAYKNGLSPYMLTLQSKIPLPATGSWREYRSIFRRMPVTLPKRPQQLVMRVIHLPELPSDRDKPSATISDNTLTAAQNWRKRSISLYKDFLDELDKLGVKNLGQSGVRGRVESIAKKYRERSTLLAPAGSALHLAIDWSLHTIIKDNVKVISSLKTYFYRVFSSGIFLHRKADFFSQLDKETHKNILINTLNNRKQNPNTQSDLVDTWFRVYRFAYSTGYINESVLEVTISTGVESRRVGLIWPSNFDENISKWRNQDHYELNLLAQFSEILYYVGLREDEVIELQIRDIIVKGNSCYIIIRDGKSDNARRNIPFHLFAPIGSVKRLQEYWRQRSLLSSPGSKSALFCPRDSTESYDEKSLFNALRDGLKQLFGPLIVPHNLRHSFFSIYNIRTVAVDLPCIKMLIPDPDHEVFSEEMLSKLRCHFFDNLDREMLGEDNTALWHGAKIMAHASPEEGLYTYGHVFLYIQKAHYERLNRRISGLRNLTRETAKLLLPNVRSSSTRSKKLPPKLTISESLDDAWKDI